jgi:Carboxypeptidase regulatory-like domain
MVRRILPAAAVVLLCLVHIEAALAQSTNASVGGLVQDASQAYIPGVTVTATNTQTGVVTTAVSNESGAYNIPSLLPGTYKLTAELPGFKTQIFNDVQLGQSATARYNFTLSHHRQSEMSWPKGPSHSSRWSATTFSIW